MALQDLIAAMEREAASQVTAVVAQGREEADRISREARERVESREASSLAAYRAELRQDTNRVLAAERRRWQTERLRLRQEVLDRIRRTALDLLPGVVQEPAYQASAVQDLEGSLGYLDGDALTIRAAPGLTEKLARRNGRHVTVTPDEAIRAGFVLASRDGSAEVDQRLEHRLEAEWTALAIWLATELEVT